MMMAGLLVKLGVGRVDKRARQGGRGRVLEHPRRDELIFDFRFVSSFSPLKTDKDGFVHM